MLVSSLSNRLPKPVRQIFPRRTLIPLSQRYLWQIETGVVRTSTWMEDGNPIALGLWGPGDIVGGALSTADPYRIECLTDVEVTSLFPEHWHQATQSLILHIQRAEELAQILHCRHVHVSLLQLLNWLAKRFGNDVEQGRLINLRLTHQDIAELLGATRVTITRTLKDFEKQGIIRRNRQRVIILREQTAFWHYEI